MAPGEIVSAPGAREHPASPGASGQDDSGLREKLQAEVARYAPPWLRDQLDDIDQLAWLRLDDALKKDVTRRRHLRGVAPRISPRVS